MKGTNQFTAYRRSFRTHSLAELAAYAIENLQKRRRKLVLLAKPDGTVRMLAEDLLEDDSGRGVVGYFNQRATLEEIQEALQAFLASHPEYMAEQG